MKTEFITKARAVHGNKYDYSKVNYINSYTKVIIICPKHGEFEQRPNGHLKGYGCFKCIVEKSTFTLDEFITKARAVHGNKYDYSKVNYINSYTKVIIICPNHGEFNQLPYEHLRGRGCNECFKEKYRYNNGIFISKAKLVHGDKYDYSKVNYINAYTKIIIICHKHGKFEQQPREHLRGKGCSKCHNEVTSVSQMSNTDEFISKVKIIHGDRYDYSEVQYTGVFNKVKIKCSKHGIFEQTPNCHLNGQGCPKCIPTYSSGHEEMVKFLEQYIDVKINDRKIIKPYELDIFIPKFSIGIEYNGLYYHSYGEHETRDQKYRHYDKINMCNDKNIFLFQFFENEWIKKQNIVKSMILNKMGFCDKIYARECKVVELDNQKYREFVIDNHLLGYIPSQIRLGLSYDDELVMVMSFSKHIKYDFEIMRFASKLNKSVVGGASKLFSYFIKKFNPKTVLTYANRRYSNGLVYQKLGFNLVGITCPNYFYVKHLHIYSRIKFQKHKLNKLLDHFNPELTESENMFNNGYRRIWDSGNLKFIYLINQNRFEYDEGKDVKSKEEKEKKMNYL